MAANGSVLYRLIVETAMREDVALRSLGEGIFLMPELAFAYLVGREVATRAIEVFGDSKVRWHRELKIGPSGPCDLVFEGDEGDKGLAVEFKMRGTVDSYINDLNKLSEVDGQRYDRFFCALVDVWPDKRDDDPRLAIAKRVYPRGYAVATVWERAEFFSTLQRRYQSQLCCFVGLWRIEV